jgi:hypothetical protein
VVPLKDQIVHAAREQLAHGRYAPSVLYGDGYVSGRLADSLASAPLYVQKKLHYVNEAQTALAGS